MSRLWNKKIQAIEPYVAGEQPSPDADVIKINTNENPYPPSPKAREVLDTLDAGLLRLYPDPESQDLKAAIAAWRNVGKENVFCSNGSDEVLAFCFQAFFEPNDPDRPLLMPAVGYSFYPIYAKMNHVMCEKIGMNADLSVSPKAFCRLSGGVVIANPNAPTGTVMGLDDIEKIVAYDPDRVVLIDEAYFCFAKLDAAKLISRYDNLLLVGTLSKSHALAGLRVGYALGSPELIEGLRRVRDTFNSYPLDAVAQRVAAACVADEAYMSDKVKKIMRTRDELSEKLSAMDFELTQSKANFVFARPRRLPARQIYEKLREMGILIRYFDAPVVADWLRISVGTPQQMAVLIKALQRVMAAGDA